MKRNDDARSLFRAAALTPDDIDFDFDLVAQHSVVLGDLNYRIQSSPDAVLRALCAAHRAQKAADEAGDKGAGLLATKAEALWEEVTEFDELRSCMRHGIVFQGFEEPKLRVPPSYRRLRAAAGDCGDYTDFDKVRAACSHHVWRLESRLERRLSDG
jgi:hypothetical protein